MITILVLSVIILFVILIFDIVIKWRRLLSVDKSPLRINTFDGLNSPYHPTVLYFEEGWNGWRYWMVETPFSVCSKPYWDRNECPSVHVSQDGENWTEPEGLVNPLINLDNNAVKNLDYYSDPHLVKRNDGKIELWYRLTERQGNTSVKGVVSLRRIISSDGITWTNQEVISQLNNNDGKGLGNTIVSPSLVLDDSGYKMWYVDKEVPKEDVKHGVSISESTDGLLWTERRRVVFNQDVNPWHIDVQMIDGIYYMLVYDFHNITLWASKDGVNFTFRNDVLKQSEKFGSFYRKLYRACLVKDNKEYKVYFSGFDLIDTHVGLLHSSDLSVFNIHETCCVSFHNFVTHYFQYRLHRADVIIHNIPKYITRILKHRF